MKRGFIEGSYGSLYTPTQRKTFIEESIKNGFDFYMYAPKEDVKHRHAWDLPYTQPELKHLEACAWLLQKQEKSFILGLSPLRLANQSAQDWLKALKIKIRQLESVHPSSLILLFDDIPLPQGAPATKGVELAQLHIQALQFSSIPTQICVPFYCAIPWQKQDLANIYWNELASVLPSTTTFWWTGSHVVSNSLDWDSLPKILTSTRGSLGFWDNRYARDFAPNRLFLGHYPRLNKNFSSRTDFLGINITGLYELDVLLIELSQVYNSKGARALYQKWNLPPSLNKVMPWLNTAWKSPTLPLSLSQIEMLIHLCWKASFEDQYPLRTLFFSALQSLRTELMMYREKVFGIPFPNGEFKLSLLQKQFLSTPKINSDFSEAV